MNVPFYSQLSESFHFNHIASSLMNLFSLSIVLLQFMIECFLLIIPFYPSLLAWKSILYYYLLMISFGR